MLEKNVNLQNFPFLTQTPCHKNLSFLWNKQSAYPDNSETLELATSLKYASDTSQINPDFTSVPGVMFLPLLTGPCGASACPRERRAGRAEASSLGKHHCPPCLHAQSIDSCSDRRWWGKVFLWVSEEKMNTYKFLSLACLLFSCCWKCKLWFSAPIMFWGHWLLSVIMRELVWT